MTEGLAFESAGLHGDHGCRDALRRALATACAAAGEPDMDLVISTEPPLIPDQPGRWRNMPATCPHGITYWIEPTGEQLARWVAEARRD